MPAVVTKQGVAVDTTAAATRNDTANVMNQATALIKRLNAKTASTAGAPQQPNQLLGLALAHGFSSETETTGYAATFSPDAVIHPDIVHADRSNSCIVGISVNITAAPALKQAIESGDDTALDPFDNAMVWAGRIDDEGAPDDRGAAVGPTSDAVGANGTADACFWRRRIVGSGFIGLYRNHDDPSKGLLVVFTRGLLDSGAQKDKLKAVEGRPTYREVAGVSVGRRELSIRNARRILHEVRAALGFPDDRENGDSVPDANAVPRTLAEKGVPASGSVDDIIDALRPMQRIVTPTFVNETDIFALTRTTEGTELVRYFDGMTSVADASGMIVALADGNQDLGLLVVPKERYTAEHGSGARAYAFDGGFAKAPDGAAWKPNEWFAGAAELYDPVIVLKAGAASE
jgi:hypothetical protein